MAAPSVANIIRVPGRLIWNPSDLGDTSGTPPSFGGTFLGITRDQEFAPDPVIEGIWAEELGAWADVLYLGERPLFKAVLRYPDADALSTIMPKAIASGSSGVHWLFRPGGTTENTRAGSSLFGNAGKLLFAPHAKTAHPMLIMYNAVPALDVAARIQFSLKREWGVAVAFWGTPDSSGRVYDTGQRANLVL